MWEREGIPARLLVSVRQASNDSGIPRRTIYGWIRAGKCWHTVIGGQIMLRRDEVSKWNREGTAA